MTLNEIVNHPEIRPFMGGFGYLDAEELRDDRNVIFEGDGWAIVYFYRDEGVYDIHVCFMPDKRGRFAIEKTKETLKAMFLSGADLIIGAAHDHRTRLYGRMCGFVHSSELYGVEYGLIHRSSSCLSV